MHTPFAPIAKALTMSLAPKAAVDKDRHTAGRFHDFRQHVDGGADAILDTPAMVGDHDPIDAGVGGELGVLEGEDAFEQELAFDGVAQALDDIPGQVGDGPVTPPSSMPVKFGLLDR